MAVKEKMVDPACGETIFELDGPGGGSISDRKMAAGVWPLQKNGNLPPHHNLLAKPTRLRQIRIAESR